MEEDEWEVVPESSGNRGGSGVSAEDVAYFQRTFGVSDAVLVLKEMVLWDSMQGWLYLSRRHVCFVGGLIRKTVVVVDLRDVVHGKAKNMCVLLGQECSGYE